MCRVVNNSTTHWDNCPARAKKQDLIFRLAHLLICHVKRKAECQIPIIIIIFTIISFKINNITALIEENKTKKHYQF